MRKNSTQPIFFVYFRIMTKRILFIVCIWGLSLLQCFAESAQSDKALTFEMLTNADGLSHNNVKCVFQDSKGFLWIGTNSGLNRYDGKSFLSFKNIPQDAKTISSNKIYGICEDKHQNLWIATDYGFNQIIRETYQCNRYLVDTSKNAPTVNNTIQGIFCDSEGNIWVKTIKTISRLTIKTGKLHSYVLENDIFREEFDIVASPIFQDSQGILWIGTENGLGYYEPSNDDFIFFKTDEYLPNYISNNHILSIFEDSNNHLWIGTENGLNEFNKSNKQFVSYYYSDQIKSIVNGIAEGYAPYNLWITTQNNGLYRFNTHTKEFTHIAHTTQRKNISTNQTNCVVNSRNILWIGTQNGLNKLDLKPKRFQLLGNEDLSMGIKYNYTSAICIEKNLVFFGTKFGGLQIYDLTKQTRKTYSADLGNFPSNTVTSIIKLRNNEILIGCDGYLILYNIATQRFSSIDQIYKELHSFCITKKKIKSLLYDAQNNLWIGTNHGIVRFNTETKEISLFDKSELPSNQINCFYENHKNIVYIGTEDGVCYYSYKSGLFTEIPIVFPYSTSVNKHIYDITEDYNGNIWMGSNVGLIKCDAGTIKCSIFTTNDGLSSNEVYSVLTNGKDVWIGTDNGLSAFYTETGVCKKFSLHDGIQDYEFSPHSAIKANNGYMFFGGTQGINIFHPDSIYVSSIKPNLEFLGLDYTNNDEKNHLQIKNGQSVNIPYNNTNLKVSFASLDFTKPMLNQYKYYLEGYTSDWTDLGNNNYFDIVKLPVGKYTLYVQASNDDGIWSETKSVKIIVNPPFWRTKLAYTIEILLVIILIIFILKQFTAKTRRANQRLLEKQEILNRIEEQQVELEIKNKSILDSINYAKRIQLAIMPARAKFRHLLPSSFILYLPKDIVSGDFYWITEIDTKIFIACSDCTGHGVPGAFMSIIGYNLLRTITKDKHIHNASEILNYLNMSLIELLTKNELDDDSTVKDGMDISICVFDKKTCVMEFAGALSRMLIFRNNQFITIRGDKYPVGLNNDQDEPYTNAIIRVQPNDRFFMFSDGYADQFGGSDGKKLKFKRFKANILACQHLPLMKQGIELKKQLQQWQGNWEQVDDILVMGFDFNVYLEKKEERIRNANK